jgi:hypothetical protein
LPEGAVDPKEDRPRSLRGSWPDPLAEEWLELYPQLFDADDLRCTRRQPALHFWEWYGAIHIFEREGAHSLVEKYVYKNHPIKAARLAEVLSQGQIDTLNAICRETHAEPPDLFVYLPGTHRFWFVEVKVPPDRVRINQAANHKAITGELGVPVKILTFNQRLANASSSTVPGRRIHSGRT